MTSKHEQTLTDDFWRLYKNVNCAFPLNKFLTFNIKYQKCADWFFSKTFSLIQYNSQQTNKETYKQKKSEEI